MKTHSIQNQLLTRFASASAFVFLALATPRPAGGVPLGTAFTYQGRLTDGGDPANGNYELQFAVFDSLAFGNRVGNIVPPMSVTLSNGLFTVILDFGTNVFTGDARWLAIGVRTNGSPSSFTPLSPLQPLTAAPSALYSSSAGFATLAGAVSPGVVTRAGIQDGQVVKSLNGLSDSVTLSAGANVTLTTIGNSLQLSASGGTASGWGLGGNSGTTSANFLGTTDNHPLELRANNSRVLRLEDVSLGVQNRTNSANITGGFSINSIASGTLGATIGGGGYGTFNGLSGFIEHPNRVFADFGTVSGGADNTASGEGSTVSGGSKNLASGQVAVGGLATVSGGENNRAIGYGCTVSGGFNNTASGRSGMSFVSSPATVGGGQNNNASGDYATVPGGSDNTASGAGSLAAGRSATARHDGSFVWGDGTQAANSTGPNTFSVLAQGGIGFYVNNAAVIIAADGTLSTKVLTITGGMDVAEPFQMSRVDIPKGAVVIIDEDHPGRLKMSDLPYDTRVAGIVSGANGINPGISLSQQGLIEGGQNVALSGRVYVLADASSAPIKPGDLLTTSGIAGHAMKVTDHGKAQGAILGKAMSALMDGEGIVLVLVTLQ